MASDHITRPETLAETQPEPAGTLRFPCSSSQQRCWFIDALDPGSAALNVALRWEMTGPIRDADVERAFNTIIARHEVLRTRFVLVDGEPMQEVAPELAIKMSIIDLRHLPENTRDGEARHLAELEAHTPFDISELPLIRVTLLRLAADRINLLLTVHQIAFDGWSIRVISDEFGALAQAYDLGRPDPLPELPLQYGDYALWQKQYLAAHAASHERYWYDQLVHAPYLEVPGDFPKPARPTHRGIILAEMLSSDIGDRLEEEARRLGVTPFTIGCTATVALIKRLTGQTDIILGTQIAGRDEADLEPMIGVFINNLVLRVDTRHAHRFDQLLARTNETVLDALSHQRMPFHRLVELLNPPRDPARTPLISINFTMLKEVMDARAYGRLFLSGLPSVSAGSLYDLNFFVVKWPDGWRMAMEYNPDIFREDSARAFIRLWREAMERAVTEPAFALDQLVVPERTPAAPAAAPERQRHDEPRHTEPADPETLAALALIWREVLGVEVVDAASDFFALGGHSLLAIRMLARIEARFGKRIDPLSLFEAPTLGELARHLAPAPAAATGGGAEPHTGANGSEALLAPWNVVRIQPKGARRPIIALNNTLAYYTVSRAIGGDRPFLGIQMFDPNTPRELAERSFEDIAADYVRLIKAAQPQGPYVLMGLCVAGALAYEAACQLEQAGEEVPLVILADTWRPGYLAGLPKAQRGTFNRAYRWHVLKRHRAQLSAKKTTLLDVLASYPKIRATGLLDVAARLRLIPARPLNHGDWSNRWFLPLLEQARERYRPPPFGGHLVLLRSEEMITTGVGDDMGWAGLARIGPTAQAVPGWHVEMFQEEGARVIAGCLERLLAGLD